MFSRKFQRMAEQFQDAIFIDIMGDETNDTRVCLPQCVPADILSAIHAEAYCQFLAVQELA